MQSINFDLHDEKLFTVALTRKQQKRAQNPQLCVLLQVCDQHAILLSPPMNLDIWERKFEARVTRDGARPPSHDILHVKRVVENAKRVAVPEGANLAVVLPSAWPHDLIIRSKDDAERSSASRLAAREAVRFLREEGYPPSLLPQIEHCIEAHSFSAQIDPQSLEAEVVQDADRLDAIGAIGMARCFAGAEALRQVFYNEDDPFAENRSSNDRLFTLDHFFVKLMKIPATLRTRTGRIEGERRCRFMQLFMSQLRSEFDFMQPA